MLVVASVLAIMLSLVSSVATYSFLPVVQTLFPEEVSGLGSSSDPEMYGEPLAFKKVSEWESRVKSVVNNFYVVVAGEGTKSFQLIRLVGFIISLVVLSAIIGFGVDFLFIRVQTGGNALLRATCYEHLVKLPYQYFVKERSGTILSRMTNDIEGVIQMVSGSVANIVINFFVSASLLVVLLVINAKLVLIMIPVGILISVFSIGIGEWMKSNKRKILVVQAAVTSVIQETLSGIKVVKIFNRAQDENTRWRQYLQEWRRLEALNAASKALPNRFKEITSALLSGAVVFLGGVLIIRNELSVPELILFFVVLTRFQQPVNILVGVWFSIKEGMASTERVYSFLNEPQETDKGVKRVSVVKHGIKFEKVSFSYGDGLVLRDIDLFLPTGKTLALVGESGSGKSTLVDIILGLYYPTKGRILVDGVDVKDFEKASYRNLFGVVSQDVFLFHDTVGQNIAYGASRECPIDKIRKAAVAANAHGFISHLADGYDTVIGDRGVRLSGGQRQRIAIARALVRDPQVMVFDEATSALDSKSEHEVQQAINALSHKKTTIIIAHRLSTVTQADIIAVISKGRIIEFGSSEELLRKRGQYYQMLLTQQMSFGE